MNLFKVDPKFYKTLMEKNTGTLLFYIPISSDEKEKINCLQEQVLFRLINYSNLYENYDKAIDIVQAYLKVMILKYYDERDIIRKAADNAGGQFLKIVKDTKIKHLHDEPLNMMKCISEGKMFLRIKQIGE